MVSPPVNERAFTPPVLVLATGNRHKYQELCDLLTPLQIPLRSLADYSPVPAVDEDGRTIQANARKKAIYYAQQFHQWVLADDTALEVDALGGAPGVRSARYAGPHASMTDHRALLLEQLRHVPLSQRSARFVCQLALADPKGAIVAESTGECLGRILNQPADGPYGFGYDVLFEVTGIGRTLAELSPAETAAVGHRGHAVRALLAEAELTAFHHAGKKAE